MHTHLIPFKDVKAGFCSSKQNYKSLDGVDLFKLFKHSQLLTDAAKRMLASEVEHINHLLRDLYADEKVLEEALKEREIEQSILINSLKSITKRYGTDEDNESLKHMLEHTHAVSLWWLHKSTIFILHRYQAKLDEINDCFIKHEWSEYEMIQCENVFINLFNDKILNYMPMGEYYLDPKGLRLYQRIDKFDIV